MEPPLDQVADGRLPPPKLKGFLRDLSSWYAGRPDMTDVTILDGPVPDSDSLRDRLIEARHPVVVRGYLRESTLDGLTFADLKRRAGRFMMDPCEKPRTIVQNYGRWVASAPAVTLQTYIETALEAETPAYPDMYHHYRNLRIDETFAESLGLIRPDFLADEEVKDPCLWIGRQGSTTSMHTDPHDNFVLTVIGRKRFHLYSPGDVPNLYLYPVGNTLFLRSPVDPRHVDAETYPLAEKARCLRVELYAGDLFYLPVGWAHMVETLENAFTYNYWLTAESRPYFDRRPRREAMRGEG